MKFYILRWFVVLLPMVMLSQEKETGPNAVYESFSIAYKALDAKILQAIYTTDGVLLNLYDSSPPNSIVGNKKISAYFSAFFKKSAESGQKLELEFKITSRQIVGNTIYDNGYYRRISKISNEPNRYGYGKLSTVLVYQENRWKFKIDSNTNTTQEEFDNAQLADIPQPN